MKKCEVQLRTYMTLLERDREKIEEGREEGNQVQAEEVILLILFLEKRLVLI